MTTEQMDWLDDERAGRHNYVGVTPESLVDKVKPDPMRGASLRERLRAMGAVRTKQQSSESVEWVNAPLEVVVEQAKRAASAFPDDLHDWAATPSNGIRAWGMSGVPEIMFGDPTDEQLAAAQKRGGRNGVLIIPEAVRDHLFSTDITDITRHSEDTLFKVQAAITGLGYSGQPVLDIIGAIQNQGILFRERVTDAEEHEVPWTELLTDAEEHTHHTREARDQCAAGDHQYAVLLDDAAEREKLKAETTMAEEPLEHRDRRQWLDGYLHGFREGFERAGWRAP